MSETEREQPPEALAERLSQVFDLVGPLYRRAHHRVEQDVSTEGLTVGVRAVLRVLHANGPLTVPQMGRNQALSRQFVQRVVNDAAARGLVEPVANPAHKRSSLIRLTADGEAAIGAVLDREHAVLGGISGELSEAEVDTCLRVLTHLLDLVGTGEPQRTRPGGAPADGTRPPRPPDPA
ncbi:MarR family transcriptional regulator [Streptomyces sp. AJS327]|uniref:MarR family winged helix-turn-helix transcriptional regulator n=1 Tax=Streptomyces sp. AJS327 TaxID=2545265 RepID=UPI0015DF8E3D|nr:MarR family transcriptional regulator [Streptomyces sp. AJS327]MBA0050940.1 MarR family transcriptional regulator [Streptomyces sp. AJS327]